jgi:hypothetical protein
MPRSMNHMKHNHFAKDYTNRSHKEIDTVFTKFNRATYFNFKVEKNSEMNSLTQWGHLMMAVNGRNMLWIKIKVIATILCCTVMGIYIDKIIYLLMPYHYRYTQNLYSWSINLTFRWMSNPTECLLKPLFVLHAWNNSSTRGWFFIKLTWGSFMKICQFWLKLDKNDRWFTWRVLMWLSTRQSE